MNPIVGPRGERESQGWKSMKWQTPDGVLFRGRLNDGKTQTGKCRVMIKNRLSVKDSTICRRASGRNGRRNIGLE
jgi:hypothetical protein